MTAQPTTPAKRSTLERRTRMFLHLVIFIGIPATLYMAATMHEPANEESCTQIFSSVVNLKGFPTVNWPATAKECVAGKYFDKLMVTAETKYVVEGKALKVDDRVFSLSGMAIHRSENRFHRLGVTLPTIEVKVGGEEVELRFSTKEGADQAFKALSEAISKA